jgi:hypothetical protein
MSTLSTSSTHKIINIHLHANYDTKTVRRITRRVATDGQNIRKDVTQHFVTFRVNKDKSVTLPPATQKFTNVLSAMLRWNAAKPSAESESDLTTDSHDDPRGWNLLLHIFACDEIPDQLVKVPAEDLWHLAVVLDKWNIDHNHERVQKFYDAWYTEAAKVHEKVIVKEKVAFMRTLLWPSWYYDHADSFMASTKYLMYYDVGRVEPRNPTKYDVIIMPKRIIREYNQIVPWISR